MAGASVLLGLVAIALAAGPLGWAALLCGAVWLLRRS